ncbi:hypothetical protein PIB30_038485 [Stylosanthes scabra]|uniref:Uncharacterized protein n=1 Tax=Stylosanthes scabra TaxID=79078 RepID=A0ABU6QEK8_9FABA|nr:hypothetical protein [Stylosanthes scabra]
MARNSSETLVLIITILIIGLIILSGNSDLDGSFGRPSPPRGNNNIRKEHWPPGYYGEDDQDLMECIEECENMLKRGEFNEQYMKICIVLCKEYSKFPSHH